MAGSGYRLIFREHAVQRMAQRGIGVQEVAAVLAAGKVIDRQLVV
jgi:hypothetical protein